MQGSPGRSLSSRTTGICQVELWTSSRGSRASLRTGSCCLFRRAPGRQTRHGATAGWDRRAEGQPARDLRSQFRRRAASPRAGKAVNAEVVAVNLGLLPVFQQFRHISGAVEHGDDRERTALGVVDEEIRIDAPELDRSVRSSRVCPMPGLSASFPTAS